MHPRSLHILLIVFFLWQCTERRISDPITEVPFPPITVFFTNKPAITDTLALDPWSFFKTFEPEISYFDRWQDKPFEIDTLNKSIIYPVMRYVVIRHRYDALNYYEYLVRAGDSIEFTYANGYPVASVMNRPTAPLDYSYEHFIREKVVNDRHSPVTRYFNCENYLDYTLPPHEFNQEKNKIRLLAYNNAKQYLKREGFILDSIFKTEKLSNEVFHFYKRRNANLSLIVDMKEDSLTEIAMRNALKMDSIGTTNFPDKYHYQFLDQTSDYFFAKPSQYVDLEDGINRDYREVFDKIADSKWFTQSAKNYLLTREIDRIGRSFSSLDFKTSYKKYMNIVTDSSMKNFITVNNFLILHEEISSARSLVLMKTNKQETTLQDLIQKNKGKVIFIDFWASWCAPCRQSMPASLQLHQDFLNAGVKFFYISIDKKINSWERAFIAEHLDKEEFNLIALNFETADFTKKYVISSIPRYMVVDKLGNIVHANAPHPDSKSLKELINQLLLQ